MIKIIVVLTILIPSPVFAGKWTLADTGLQVIYSGLLIADWNQTLQIKDHENIEEANKILGKHPSDEQVSAHFTAALLGHFYIATQLSQPYRAYWQVFWITSQFATVRNNERIGLHVDFNF